ncbi:MAG: transcription antitermination factor NusB [Sphingobacteriales bacterium]|nr:MAG: transcription antitermination factor NusB [Sphingobacteriales bacterium]
MISRRNIRVKVMQTLYTLSTTETSDVEKRKRIGSNILNEKLTRSLDLLTISILYTLRTAQYAENDSIQRSSKYLPTQEDLNVNTKIAGNEFLWQILGNQTFVEKVKESKSEHFVDEEWIKKIYQQLAKSNEYQEYISVQSRDAKSEKAIIQFIWEKLILENEALQEHFSEEMPGWEDDREMTLMLMENFFKSGSKTNFLVPVSGEKKEYAYDLMNTVQDKEEYIMQLIQPRLINWDAERIALIDLILLRMGVAELLYFPTIPTKVTINEYIEVGKMYSTLQSGQFINGVLDNILKDLEKEKLIQKQERVRK